MHTSTPISFTSPERRATVAIALLFALRMAGLFLIVPVFTLYANQLPDATPFLIGIALGGYGITQALLQIPFGLWSDRYGRKPIIALGFILFAAGSVIAALAHSISLIIIGRLLQGAGAVGSATLALLADLTTEQQRPKAMAIVGITIGAAFTVAMLAGPILYRWFNVPSLFLLTAGFAALALVLLFTHVPTPKQISLHAENEVVTQRLRSVLKDKSLWPYYLGIFILHAGFIASFIALPLILQQQTGLAEKQQWQIYLPVLVLSLLTVAPLLRLTHKAHLSAKLFKLAIGGLVLAQLGNLVLAHFILGIGISLWLFFTAFTLLEALLPSFVAKNVAPQAKGTAMGIFSTCQFLGIFIGGSVGGWLYGHWHATGLFLACSLLSALWLILANLKKLNY